MVIFKKTKTGLEENFPFVYDGDDIISLDCVSTIYKELKTKETYFPLFYIYIHESSNYTVDHEEFLEDVGKELGRKLSNSLEEALLIKETI